MRNLWKVISMLLLAAAITTIGASVPAQAQSPQRAMHSSSQSELSTQGQLDKVDTTKQTFTVKTADDQVIEFHYTSDTKVEGSASGIQGLSSETGTRVSVYYKEESGKRLATRIEINKQ